MDYKTKKLGNRATKAERSIAHEAKMEMKEALRRSAQPENPFVFANQSINHDEYGETPAEQTRRMLENNS